MQTPTQPPRPQIRFHVRKSTPPPQSLVSAAAHPHDIVIESRSLAAKQAIQALASLNAEYAELCALVDKLQTQISNFAAHYDNEQSRSLRAQSRQCAVCDSCSPRHTPLMAFQCGHSICLTCISACMTAIPPRPVSCQCHERGALAPTIDADLLPVALPDMAPKAARPLRDRMAPQFVKQVGGENATDEQMLDVLRELASEQL